MTQPNVTITELDGALGILPASAGKLYAVVGTSTTGPTDTPATFARTKDVIANYGGGPLVEKACHYIERTGKPVVLVRSGQTTAGLNGTIDITGVTGTSVVTYSGAPNDDYEPYFKVVTGGTVATPGITFKWSLDGGRTLSPVTALGSATAFAFPGAGGTGLAFAAGTLVAGDTVKGRTTAPQWNSTELGTALEALKNSAVSWEIVHVCGAIDAAAFDAIELKIAALFALGKFRAWIGNARVPSVAESEATYLAALNTIFSAKASTFGQLCAGACKLTSSVNGRKYKRPVSFAIGARTASVSEEVNVADPNLGGLVGVDIRDANGNLDEHDESANPGLDDARFTVLRTIEGYAGVYVNRPILFAPSGSDFRLMPHRRVMALAEDALRAFFMRRLNKPIRVSLQTGFILETEALEIEAGAMAVLRGALMAKPKASGVEFALSRTDLLLSTFTLTGDARVTPLAYPEQISLTVGFRNPALQVLRVAA